MNTGTEGLQIKSLIAQLRAAREDQDLTQAQLAERAGYSRNAIYFLESGRRGTRLDTFTDCATALGMELALVPKGTRRAAHRPADLTTHQEGSK